MSALAGPALTSCYSLAIPQCTSNRVGRRSVTAKPLGRGPLSSFPPDPLGLVDKVQQGGGINWLLGVTG